MAVKVPHDVARLGEDRFQCKRCGRQGDAAHRASLTTATCQVAGVRQVGAVWQEGEAELAKLLARVAAFRRWAEPAPKVGEHQPQQEPVLPLPADVAGLNGHLLQAKRPHAVGSIGRRVLCLWCFAIPERGMVRAFKGAACPGLGVAGAVPGFLVDALRRRTVRVEDPQVQVRVRALAVLVGAVAPPAAVPGPAADVAGSLIGRALLAGSRAAAGSSS